MRKAPLYSVLQKWGGGFYISYCLDSLSDLGKQVGKYLIGKENSSETLEAIAHVMVGIEFVKIIFEIPDKDVDDTIEGVIRSLERRLKEKGD